MSTMRIDNGAASTDDGSKRVETLEKAHAVQVATQAGAEATRGPTMAGAQATQAAAPRPEHGRLWQRVQSR
jgi:hypothetical protein